MVGVAQLVGASSYAVKVAGSIPGQGTYIAFRFYPSLVACGRQLVDVSLLHHISLSFPTCFSLKKKMNKNVSSGED